MPEDSMRTERFEGQPPSFEQRQVDQAITKVRAQRPDLYPMSGGAGLPDATPPTVSAKPELLLSSEEREKRERRATYLSGFSDRLSTTDNPQAMRRLVRQFMASIEGVVEMPDTPRIDAIRSILAEKAIKFKDAQDPEFARQTGLDKEGLVERVVVRDALKPDGFGGFEIELSNDEANVLLDEAHESLGSNIAIIDIENGRRHVSLSAEQARILRFAPETRRMLEKKETITIPPGYSPGELKAIAETAEELRKEVLTRTKIFIAYYLYQSSSFSLSLLTGHDARYTGISTDEWKTLVTLKESRPGEHLAYGDKIDGILRLLCLIAEIGGDKEGGGKLDEGDYREREEKLKQLINRQPQYLQDLINTYSAIDDEDGKKKSGVEWLVKVSKKNVFAKPASGTYDLKEVRETLEKILGGEESDTHAAGENAYRLFRMWGIAAHYDHKSWKKDKKTGGGALVPQGPAVSDCTAGLQYFELDRRKDVIDGYPHGPDATLGKYPVTIVKSFLHSTAVSIAEDPEDRKLKNQRSLWELWWNKGYKLSDLPWDRAGNGAWFRYNFQLSNIGKKEKGFHDMAMTPLLAKDLMNIETLRGIYNAIKLSITATAVHGGEIEEFLRNRPGAREFDSGALEESFLEPLRRETRTLILVGVLANAYQGYKGRWGWKEWGEFVPGWISKAKVDNKDKIIAETTREDNMRLAGEFGVDWDEVRKRVNQFLSQKKIPRL